MTDQQYNLVFRGDIAAGHKLAEVKQRLANLFKTPPEKIEKLFSGRPVAIKKGLAGADAERYLQALTAAGAVVEKVANTATKPAPAKPSLAERLGQIEDEAPQEAAPAQQLEAKPVSNPEPAPASEPETPAEVEIVLQAVAPSVAEDAVAPSAPGLSLRPMTGHLLDDVEKVYMEPAEVDVSGLSLAEAKGDLLTPEEKPVYQELDLNVDFELAPVGSYLSEVTDDIPQDLAAISIDD